MQGTSDSSATSLGLNDPLHRDWLSERLARDRTTASSDATKKSSKTQEPENNDFTIVTWNIWFSQCEWQARLEAALAETLAHDADVFCFQEVRSDVHQSMLNCTYLRERYDPTEERLPHGYDCSIWIKRDVRIKVAKVCSIPLRSIYGRRGLCVDLQLNRQTNIRVVTSHLESGEEMDYTRCGQLETLFKFIRNTPFFNEESMDVAFLVGDYNLDPSYPENEIVEQNGMDVWKELHPNDAGFTENTYQNKMLYSAHGKHKQVRYDRVVIVRPSLRKTSESTVVPHSIKLLGTTPFDTNGELWASDHFGLVATVTVATQSTAGVASDETSASAQDFC